MNYYTHFLLDIDSVAGRLSSYWKNWFYGTERPSNHQNKLCVIQLLINGLISQTDIR